MSCPSCERTLQKIDGDRPVFWCPNCGTLVEFTGSFPRNEVPGLLRRLVAHVDKGGSRVVNRLEVDYSAAACRLISVKVNDREIL